MCVVSIAVSRRYNLADSDFDEQVVAKRDTLVLCVYVRMTNESGG